MKFVVLLAVAGLASCLPTPYGDIEYSYIDATGRLIKVELDTDDLVYGTASAPLPAALPQPLSYMGVNALPAATRVLATPVATQYAQMTRYVYVDEDDLDDDTMYVQVAQPAAPSTGVMTYSAPAPAPAPAVAVAPAMPLAAAPVPTLKAVAMPGQIKVVHKYKSDDDDDDSAEK